MDASLMDSGPPRDVGPLPFVAVRVHVSSTGQWHAALVYWSEEERKFHQIDLAFHNHLRRMVCRFEQGAWVRVVVPDDGARIALQNLVAMCRSVADRYAIRREGIPYGTSYAGGLFTIGDGAYSRDVERESGLTCATFVLSLFESVEWPLVDRASWPEDPERCARWRDGVVSSLLQAGFTEQADRVRGDAVCVRFLPTEVAGACLWPSPEVSFTKAREGADHVERAATGSTRGA